MNDIDVINHLFSGGFNGVLGMKVTEWSLGYVKARMEVGEVHLSPLGRVHGGVYCSILDMACGLCGNYCTVDGNMRSMVTVSLTTSFVGKPIGKILWIEGQQISGGRSIFTSNATIKDEEGNLVAHATGTFKWGKGSHLPEGVPIKEGSEFNV